ncbi:sigma-70 family RNA polymerase sigma factor [Segatella copri]|uniref:sigma-70 family RNA polymerase sigma factor n=1 Tax=Segatella copri TaxID=165179 RepID=UPI001F1D31DF|nr:sigma-70 family RNA polymerase sigma factor [Segatella copri]
MRQLKISKSITNRESASLDKYLQEIGHEELLTTDQEVELAQRIRKGDKRALERLTKANLRFVVSVAKQYQNQGLSLPDLINEGNVGLIKAAEKFDETRGFKKKNILQAIAEQSRLVRLPLNQVGSVNKITRELNKFEQEHERKPSVDEIAERVDLPEDKIADAMKANSRHVSMDAPIADGEDSSMIDFLAGDSSNTDKELAIESLKAEVSRILKLLTDKEQKVLRAFFGIDGSPEMTLDEIGEKYNLTRERVRQIKEKALRRLRHNTKNKLLKSYLGQ